jgi:hypothetical protein
MSHFYGDLKGSRGRATRCGTSNSGIVSHVRGWNIGCRAEVYVDDYGVDCVKIWITGGSNGHQADKFLGVWQKMDDIFVKME